MGHEMIQRMFRNKKNWLRTMLQLNPVLVGGSVEKAIETTAIRQFEELKDIRKKILVYEKNGCVAEKLTDTI